jgi:transcriptional regulator with XRE-family HTH domain
MENREASKPRRKNESGPVGDRARGNLRQLRENRGLSQAQLAGAAERLGRPMTMQIVGKTEQGDRRIDIDDLVAFAVALCTTPNRLLLTGTAAERELVGLAPEVSVPELAAWRWATGDLPLPKSCDAWQLQMVLDSDREARFIRENRPHRPPDAPLGTALKAHPDLVEAILKISREVWRRGIDIRQAQSALDAGHWMAAAESDR